MRACGVGGGLCAPTSSSSITRGRAEALPLSPPPPTCERGLGPALGIAYVLPPGARVPLRALTRAPRRARREIIAFSDAVSAFQKVNTEVLAISTDSHHTHLAWVKTAREDGGLGDVAIPLVADIRCERA